MKQPNLTNYYNQDYVNKYKRKKGEGRIDRLVPYLDLKSTDTVLDVGCGCGFLAEIIGDSICCYTGIDTSKESIIEAQLSSSKSKTFIYSDIKTYSKNNNERFDKIFLIDVTEHIEDNELASLIKDSYKMLKQNGYMYVHTPNKEYFLEKLKVHGIIRQTTGHIAVRNYSEYQIIFKKAGFKRIGIQYLDHYLKILKGLSFISKLPFISKHTRARLLISAQK